MMVCRGFLGIDLGTQGLTVVFTDEAMNIIETGDGHYEMLGGLEPGCYEQLPADWEKALRDGMAELRAKLVRQGKEMEVLAIGISGQMHGEVILQDQSGTAGAVRLWCDSRNEVEEQELTSLLGVKMPKRMTSVRWLCTCRNRAAQSANAIGLTTPGGWLAQRLTGERILGIGDASGMFPVSQVEGDYDTRLMSIYDGHLAGAAKVHVRLKTLLPQVRRAGEDGGKLNRHGAELTGLKVGIPVAPAEGDQPAALAGSLIGRSGTVSMSFGTSVCANLVGDRDFQGVSRAIDHFCAADGKPINMVWLRNGTTFINTVIGLVGGLDAGNSAFERVIPELLKAPADCQGVLALPFMDDEPGLGVSRGGTAMLVGLNPANATPGNVARAALMATTFNLRMGCEILTGQGFPLEQIVLTGGLARTPALGQVIADVFRLPVIVPEGGNEGSAWGAALLAKYRAGRISGLARSWEEFLSAHDSGKGKSFKPDRLASGHCDTMFDRYKRLLSVQPHIETSLV
jgi:sugar (pentulose or hexulose) kinase